MIAMNDHPMQMWRTYQDLKRRERFNPLWWNVLALHTANMLTMYPEHFGWDVDGEVIRTT